MKFDIAQVMGQILLREPAKHAEDRYTLYIPIPVGLGEI